MWDYSLSEECAFYLWQKLWQFPLRHCRLIAFIRADGAAGCLLSLTGPAAASLLLVYLMWLELLNGCFHNDISSELDKAHPGKIISSTSERAGINTWHKEERDKAGVLKDGWLQSKPLRLRGRAVFTHNLKSATQIWMFGDTFSAVSCFLFFFLKGGYYLECETDFQSNSF